MQQPLSTLISKRKSQIADLGLQARVKGDSLLRYVEKRAKRGAVYITYKKNLNVFLKKKRKKLTKSPDGLPKYSTIYLDCNIGVHMKEKIAQNEHQNPPCFTNSLIRCCCW